MKRKSGYFSVYSLWVNVMLFCFAFLLHADESKPIHLGNNEGLSNSAINSIFQDSNGLMWFGTWDGLNRYDGAEFITFRPHFNDSTTISNNIVYKIVEENADFLWITTDYGINRFNKLTGKFKQYFLGNKRPNAFREDLLTKNSKGMILATDSNSGLYVFDTMKNDFVSIKIKSVSSGSISHLFFDSNDCLWLVYDWNKIQRITFKKNVAGPPYVLHSETISLNGVKRICYDHSGRIWMQKKDALYYILVTDPLLNMHKMSMRLKGEMNAALKKKNEYIFATTSGLITYNELKKSISVTLPDISVFSIYNGTQNVLWVGTDTRGIFKYLPDRQYFKSFTKERASELGQNATRAIYKDIDNTIWVGTKGSGLLKMTDNGQMVSDRIKVAKGSELINNSILSISAATNGNFWIGTDGNGINYYSHKQKKIKKLNGFSSYLKNKLSSVYAILQTSNSDLWIGTTGNGLFKLKIHEGGGNDEYKITGYTHFFSKKDVAGSINCNTVYALINEGDSIMWVATRGGGLNKLDIRTGLFTAIKNNALPGDAITSNDVICLLKDSREQLWIGTGDGLNRMIRGKNHRMTIKQYSEASGLANTNIHGIAEDNEHNIWISTSKGLSRLSSQNESAMNFVYDDGLQDNEFSDGAYFSTNGGRELYFGGINGFNIVYPDRIQQFNYTPKIYLNSFKIDNIVQPLNSIYDKERIISYKSKSLSFHFSVLDYIANQKYKLAYRIAKNEDCTDLKDDNDWVHIESMREIVLTNMSSGHYRLLVKYSNGASKSNYALFAFPFQITTPWWQTWYAYFLYFSLIVLVAYLTFSFQKYKIRVKHKFELEKMDEQKKEEIHQAKLNFFTNIAHEFSNSITLIYGSCECVLEHRSLNEKDKKHLSIIKRNAERMKNMIQQLMDFRKAETGYISLHFERVDVGELIRYTLDNFTDMIESRSIKLSLELCSDVPEWITDRETIEKVIFNLFSNAFKYTPVGGSIKICLDLKEQKQLRFSCTNSGEGIKPEDLKMIFNRFKVLDNFEAKLSEGSYTRNGLGLAMCQSLMNLLGGCISAESKVNEYTTFLVLLPQGKIQEKDTCDVSTIHPLTDRYHIPLVNDSKNKRVLVVEDQEDVQSLINDILSSRYFVLKAMNGIEALKILADNSPDLIICDILMPEMDGLSFLRELKKKNGTSHIPVILLSSKISVECQVEGLEIGANMFINKPFHPSYLKAAVDSVLENNEIMRDYLNSPQAYTELYNGENIDKSDKEFIDKVVCLLSQNLDNENYNQDALSFDMAISKVQLYRKIKKITNSTPSDFIRGYHLQEAEKKIRKTSKTISEIMSECGFRNKAYFYREFLKKYHFTPKEYRNQINSY